jgi:D-alanyl-D-alanine dipeptidase
MISVQLKPYQLVPIQESDEKLVEIPPEFSLVSPHPYQSLGAPYGDKSPFYLRQGVLDRLLQADETLQQIHPGWKIQIFDAYRPVAVQQFMVDYTFVEQCNAKNLNPETLTSPQCEAVLQQVYQFWAIPSLDPKTPPPHSTGAAIDITLIDELGNPIEMGSAIDEISPRSFPHHFANSCDPNEQRYHEYRQILDRVMTPAGFKRHWNEWWHFSYGDQIWAWLMNQAMPEQFYVAKYGRV